MPLSLSGRSLLVALCLVLLGGCASSSLFVPYPARFAQVSQQEEPAQALSQLSAGLSGGDQLLYAQESGRVAALAGDFAASINFYQQAQRRYQQYDWKALVSLSDLGSQALGATVSDNLIPYRGQAYERVLLHQQQSLNYLWQGQLDDALVEVRLANQAQQLAQQAYGEALHSNKALQSGRIDAELSALDKAAGQAPDSFINPYVLFSNAALYDAAGLSNDALVDLRQALQLQPSNPVLQREFVRLSCQLHIDCASAEQRFGPVMPMGVNDGRVVLLHESGQVAAKQTFWLPFHWDSNYQQIAMPYYYPRQALPPQQITLAQQSLPLARLVQFDALAARSLREQYPFLLARQAIRVATKHNGNRWAQQAGGDLGGVAMQIFNVLTEQADRRSWLSLPQQASGWSGALAAGQYQLTVGSHSSTIKVAAGRTTIVWIADSGVWTQIQSQLL
ncbi:hypothetical protein [uncultured Ferrimonas sp.]|uniref:COG3014 family protein n=1 Tax=uncultured Ferrimonas sp. TaxID=432640 RepID=UPI0026107B19|nr:hypothetical protein [uncultured Ferrimonas sp.]